MSRVEAQELYRHTQAGTVILVSMWGAALVLCLVVALVPGIPEPPRVVFTAAVVILLLGGYLFGSLTVIVRDDVVEIRFGPGLIRKRYALSEFVQVSVVRNSWIYGWGIHLIPKGWLYNVSGLDAVELVRENGRRVRIGTDEPELLAPVISDAMAALPGTEEVSAPSEQNP